MIGAPSEGDYIRDIIPNPDHNPQDTVSSLSWHPQAYGFLTCSSWDSAFRVYRVASSGGPSLCLKLQTKIETQDPLLSIGWAAPEIFAGGSIDGSIKIFDLNSANSVTVLREHTDSVKSVHFLDQILISLSYDKTLKLWDLRTPNSIKTVELNGKPYCSDMHGSKIIIGLDNKNSQYGDLRNLHMSATAFKVFEPIFHDVEKFIDISFLLDGSGFASSSDWGRGNISKLKSSTSSQEISRENILTWKGHKTSTTVRATLMYPMNAISMNPSVDGSLVSGGGEGILYFWDYNRKEKCSTLDFKGQPVTNAKFNKDGTLVAYALGYDYANGIKGLDLYKTKIGVHHVKPQDLKRER